MQTVDEGEYTTKYHSLFRLKTKGANLIKPAFLTLKGFNLFFLIFKTYLLTVNPIIVFHCLIKTIWTLLANMVLVIVKIQ